MKPQTPSLRRFDHVRGLLEKYSPLDFHSSFVLFCINDEPRFVKEIVNFEEGKIWKKAMVEEMEALDLVESLDGRKPIGSKLVFKKKLKATRKV